MWPQATDGRQTSVYVNDLAVRKVLRLELNTVKKFGNELAKTKLEYAKHVQTIWS